MLIEIEFSNNLLFNVGIRVGSNDLDVELAMHCLITSHHIGHTFNAKTVFPSFNLHRVTAPPAPSPKLPSSTIFFCSLAASHPSSSRSSASRGLPFSRLNLSKSGMSPLTLLLSRSGTPPSRSE